MVIQSQSSREKKGKKRLPNIWLKQELLMIQTLAKSTMMFVSIVASHWTQRHQWFENFVRKLSKKLLTISRNSTNFSLDWFVKRYNFNCWIVTGMVLSAPFLIWMSYMGPDERTSAVILLVTYWTVQSLNNSGFRVNHIDIAPRYLLQRVGFFF